jgi:hypothetical protein
MGAKFEDLPFPIGQMYHGDGTPALADAPQLEGKEYWVEHVNPNSGGVVDPAVSGRRKRVRIVRNVSATAMLPKRIAKMNVGGSGLEFLSQTNGFATVVGEKGYPVDEYLPAAGAPQYALYYVVVEGPATVVTAAAGDTNIALGSMVIPSTDGKVIDQDTTVVTGPGLYNQIQGAIGRAVKAVNATDTDLVIDVGA